MDFVIVILFDAGEVERGFVILLDSGEDEREFKDVVIGYLDYPGFQRG